MRVAHFVQRYPPALGGSEAYFARLGEFLVKNGMAVTTFTSNADDLEAFWTHRGRRFQAGESVRAGVHVRRYALWHFPGQRRALRLLSLLPIRPWQRLTTSCNPICWRMFWHALYPREKFDVVHASAFPYGWPLHCGLTLARRLHVPFVVTPFLHLGDTTDPRDRTRRAYTSPALLSLLAQADRIFVQTDVEREALVQRGFSAGRLVLQGMGVERAHCTGGDRAAARQRWGIGPEECVVGHLANNSVEKGTVDLLKASARVWRAGRKFRMVLAGPEMPNFRAYWSHFGLADDVIRLGVLSEQEKRDFFAGIDVFALPSRSDSFGLVFLEAWANGVPSIAYRAGGVPGVIRDGEDGLLVRCGDLTALAEALVGLAEDPSLRKQMGSAGERRLDRDFRWQDKLELVRNVYRELAQEASRERQRPEAPSGR